MTEKEIVYSIIETLNNYEYNNDNRLSERLIRNFLHTYRPLMINDYYKQGINVTDECIQTIPIEFKKGNFNQYEGKIPQVLELTDKNGVRFSLFDITIPIVNSTTFSMLLEEDYPIIKKQHSKAFLKIKNRLSNCIVDNSEASVLHKELKSGSRNNSIKLDLNAILMNPSDDKNYNWTTDDFPFPAEKLDDLKSSILRKEFGISSNIKSDEVQNNRQDNIRYHENTNVEQ